jgi:uncharacterized protein (DUF849 family)
MGWRAAELDRQPVEESDDLKQRRTYHDKESQSSRLEKEYDWMSPLLSVALSGSRSSTEHPGIPRAPQELAKEARASVEAGAQIVHLHAYDPSGVETLAAGPCAAAVRAVRAVCPGVPISLTTSAGIEPDPRRRLKLIAAWTELPELVTANQGEEGILELYEHLMQREVGIEAGLLSLGDANAFVRSGIADRFKS